MTNYLTDSDSVINADNTQTARPDVDRRRDAYAEPVSQFSKIPPKIIPPRESPLVENPWYVYLRGR